MKRTISLESKTLLVNNLRTIFLDPPLTFEVHGWLTDGCQALFKIRTDSHTNNNSPALVLCMTLCTLLLQLVT